MSVFLASYILVYLGFAYDMDAKSPYQMGFEVYVPTIEECEIRKKRLLMDGLKKNKMQYSWCLKAEDEGGPR